MTQDEANLFVNSALDQLLRHDSQLLDLKACERALHFRIAHYMAQSEIIQPPLTIDCEYNRHHSDQKLLRLLGRDRPSMVFPDILVHERDSDNHNILVLEIKRPGQRLNHDQNKLQAFVEQLGYHHAGHLIIGHNRNGTLIREVIWING